MNSFLNFELLKYTCHMYDKLSYNFYCTRSRVFPYALLVYKDTFMLSNPDKSLFFFVYYRLIINTLFSMDLFYKYL